MMNILEILALTSTVMCVILSSKENILAWPVGIVSVISLICVYVSSGMYAQIILQLVFFIQCIIGWVNWGKKVPTRINNIDRLTLNMHLTMVIILGVMYGLVNMLIIDSPNPIFPFFDGIAAFIALLGNWYLTRKTIETWLLFMVYNIMMVTLLLIQGVYLIASLNFCLFFISINGFISWQKNIKKI